MKVSTKFIVTEAYNDNAVDKVFHNIFPISQRDIADTFVNSLEKAFDNVTVIVAEVKAIG